LIHPAGRYDYFARFFEGTVRGLVTVTKPDGGQLKGRFRAGRIEGRNSSSTTSFGGQDQLTKPGFEGLDGDLYGLDSGTGGPARGGFYDLVLRVDDDQICLHLEGDTACRVADSAPPLSLLVGVGGEKQAIVAGEVSDEVAEVYVEGGTGRYPAQLVSLPGGMPDGVGSYFLTTPAPTPGEPFEVVALDEDGNVIDRNYIDIDPPS
jgi:hypothetical protein